MKSAQAGLSGTSRESGKRATTTEFVEFAGLKGQPQELPLRPCLLDFCDCFNDVVHVLA